MLKVVTIMGTYSNWGTGARPAPETVAGYLHCSRSTVRNRLAAAVHLGLLRVAKPAVKGRQPATFDLCDPRESPAFAFLFDLSDDDPLGIG
jgi:hypothetical protein